jgi:hypothetical protein
MNIQVDLTPQFHEREFTMQWMAFAEILSAAQALMDP